MTELVEIIKTDEGHATKENGEPVTVILEQPLSILGDDNEAEKRRLIVEGIEAIHVGLLPPGVNGYLVGDSEVWSDRPEGDERPDCVKTNYDALVFVYNRG